MRLEWQDSMSVGNAVLDGQHRQLLRLLDGLRMAVEEGHIEAAHVAILEFQELTITHFAAEETFAPGADLYSSAQHVAAHRNAAAHIENLRQLIDDHKGGCDARKLKRTIVDIVLALFSHDRDIRWRVAAPERRRFPRFPGTGLKADIDGRHGDIIDISVSGMRIGCELAKPGDSMAIGLTPKIRDNLLENERIEVICTVLRVAEDVSTVTFENDDYEKVWAMTCHILRIPTTAEALAVAS